MFAFHSPYNDSYKLGVVTGLFCWNGLIRELAQNVCERFSRLPFSTR